MINLKLFNNTFENSIAYKGAVIYMKVLNKENKFVEMDNNLIINTDFNYIDEMYRKL